MSDTTRDRAWVWNELVRRLRQPGETSTALCGRLGIPQSTMSQLCSGTRPATIALVHRLATAAGLIARLDLLPSGDESWSLAPPMPTLGPALDDLLDIDYTNWRGERAWRRIRPDRLVWEDEGTSPFHKGSGWVLVAFCLRAEAERRFRLVDIHEMRVPE